jgi:putative redox protein
MIHIEVNRVNGDYGFEATDAAGHTARMDTSPETGGENFGIRPMQMLLMGLGGCSGIDIMSILKKQRQTVEGFRMLIDGEREAGKEPSLWSNIHLIFQLKGDIDPDKAYKACALSVDKYCSVAATLKEARCNVTWEVQVNP